MTCRMCGRVLNQPDDPTWSANCGGDCWACMWQAEENYADPSDRASYAVLGMFAAFGEWRDWGLYARKMYAFRKAAVRAGWVDT